MDLNAMTVFAKVAQCQSFTQAARALGLPKSTVSRRIADLERELGARLLQRTTRRLSLTDAGRTFERHCARIVAEVEDAERAVSELHRAPRGLLRVSAPLSFEFLGGLVAEYLAEHPDVTIDLVCTDRVVDLVDEGFDLAIRAGKLADSSLVARRLGGVRRRLVASPDYLERRGKPRSPAALAEHDCLVFGGGPRTGSFRLEREPGREPLEVPLRARFVVNDVGVLFEATLAGLGIALLPETRVAEALASGRLAAVLPRWSSPEVPLHAVVPSARHLAPKVKSFLAHLAARLGPRRGRVPASPSAR